MKITKIVINNYRAFLVLDDSEETLYTIDLPEGDNLLLYGENGSGKSSLFRGLRDFLASARDATLPFKKNLFYKEEDNSEKPYIRISLDDGNVYTFSSDPAGTTTGEGTAIRQAGITHGFISYRDLLRLYYREPNHEPDLFSFFLGEYGLMADEILVAPLQPTNRVSFGNLWQKVLAQRNPVDIDDFNINAAAKFDEITVLANKLLGFFENDFSFTIEYQDCTAQGIAVAGPVVTFKPKLYETDISEHDDVLNEARLTALAISVYLANILLLPPSDLRILFLDDIFTGLDMSNRLPLLRILAAPVLEGSLSFRNFQIFLTTYDRHWFEIAAANLWEGWKKLEFYVSNRTQQQDRPCIRWKETYEERAWFHFKHVDYPASANYLRKAFESMLASLLPENVLSGGGPGPDDPAIVISRRHLSMSEHNGDLYFDTKAPGGPTAKGVYTRFAGLQTLMDKFGRFLKQYRISFTGIKELESIKNRLLNPLSHDNLRAAVFKNELAEGFKIMEDLKKIESFYILQLDEDEETFVYYTAPLFNGNQYIYKIRLLEHVRYFAYGTERRILNATCEIVSRQIVGEAEELFPEKCKTLQEACKKINGISVPAGQAVTLADDIFVLNHVFTEDNQPLQELIENGAE